MRRIFIGCGIQLIYQTDYLSFISLRYRFGHVVYYFGGENRERKAHETQVF
jgi:hypothetical protein